MITVRINKLLTFTEDDIAISKNIQNLFQDKPHISFDLKGHIFTGYLKNNRQNNEKKNDFSHEEVKNILDT